MLFVTQPSTRNRQAVQIADEADRNALPVPSVHGLLSIGALDPFRFLSPGSPDHAPPRRAPTFEQAFNFGPSGLINVEEGQLPHEKRV
jgi:hypothetical protein